MRYGPYSLARTRTRFAESLALLLLGMTDATAKTAKLNIRTKNGLRLAERGREQFERQAVQYDLSRYTIIRDILIERGAMNRSHPALTLHMRFPDDDHLAPSAYVHEQAHWAPTDRHPRDARDLFEGSQKNFPNLDYHVSEGEVGTFISPWAC